MRKIVFSMVTFLMVGTSACMAEKNQETKNEVAQNEQVTLAQRKAEIKKQNAKKSQEVQIYDEQDVASEKSHKEVRIHKTEITGSMQTLHF